MRFLPFSIIAAAFVAVVVGYGGTVAINLKAAAALGASEEQTISWVAASCFFMAFACLWLTLRHRLPIMTAWSLPGMVLIIASDGAASMEEAVGAFLLAAALMILTGLIRPLGRLIEAIPTSIAAAMLAGILIRFVVDLFIEAQTEPAFILPLILTFLVVRLFQPIGAVLAVLSFGIVLALALGLTEPLPPHLELARPVLILPVFEPAVLIGLGLPLYVVTMASQNLPGFAVMRAHGYPVPFASILVATGAGSAAGALFGAHAINLSAVTASICVGPDSHKDPAMRWKAGIPYAVFYMILGLFSAGVVTFLDAMPQALIAAVAGTALAGPLTGALGSALAERSTAFAAVLTLTVTMSGISVAGIGSAFWGLGVGLAVLALERMASAIKR